MVSAFDEFDDGVGDGSSDLGEGVGEGVGEGDGAGPQLPGILSSRKCFCVSIHHHARKLFES